MNLFADKAALTKGLHVEQGSGFYVAIYTKTLL